MNALRINSVNWDSKRADVFFGELIHLISLKYIHWENTISKYAIKRLL